MSTRTHICVWFDDGSDEPACVCGERALLLVDENGHERFLVLLGAESTVELDTTPLTLDGLPRVEARAAELAISA